MTHKVAQPDQHRMLTNGAGDGCGEAVTRKLWRSDHEKIAVEICIRDHTDHTVGSRML